MAEGDIIDIGGRAFMEVGNADNKKNEEPGLTYAPVFQSAEGASFGSTSDAPWNGTDADATVISLLKKIALNTTP